MVNDDLDYLENLSQKGEYGFKARRGSAQKRIPASGGMSKLF
jgi:hypothetical protein